jgi:hypothetical protein
MFYLTLQNGIIEGEGNQVPQDLQVGALHTIRLMHIHEANLVAYVQPSIELLDHGRHEVAVRVGQDLVEGTIGHEVAEEGSDSTASFIVFRREQCHMLGPMRYHNNDVVVAFVVSWSNSYPVDTYALSQIGLLQGATHRHQIIGYAKAELLADDANTNELLNHAIGDPMSWEGGVEHVPSTKSPKVKVACTPEVVRSNTTFFLLRSLINTITANIHKYTRAISY